VPHPRSGRLYCANPARRLRPPRDLPSPIASLLENILPPVPDLAALHKALVTLPGFTDVMLGDLRVLPTKGLAHDHIELRGRTVLLRVPKQSQWALEAGENLAYQAACFERVSDSGRGPKLYGVIAPSREIPLGALAVERIAGRPPRLPEDLPALAEAMARVHALPLPPTAARPPLADHLDPVGGALAEIEAQAAFLPQAGLDGDSRAALEAELAWARDFAARVAAGSPAQPRSLVLTDTHPGNFLVTPEGRAVIVDLEKALYGAPGIDLAHATVYSSTTWDPDSRAVLSRDEVAGFYRHYLEIAGAEAAPALAPGLLALRRLLVLRALTWCAKWRVAQARENDRGSAGSTENWSAGKSDPALIAHVAGRVADYLSPASIARMRADWAAGSPLREVLPESRE
jgi:aminoglycoside phosphotransferase (APT) family kinase protein